MSYKKTLEALEALPAEEKRLTSGRYVDEDGKCGCVLGKLLSPELKESITKRLINSMRARGMGRETPLVVQRWLDLGLTGEEIEEVQGVNDEFHTYDNSDESKVARYEHVTRWLRDRIAQHERE